MYKLENSTDINEYVTAQEFPSPGKYNSNSDNGEMNTTNEVDFDFNTSKGLLCYNPYRKEIPKEMSQMLPLSDVNPMAMAGD